jgi:hypothetical protein
LLAQFWLPPFAFTPHRQWVFDESIAAPAGGGTHSSGTRHGVL